MLGCNQDNTETTLSTAPGALAIRCGANARVTDNVPKKWDSVGARTSSIDPPRSVAELAIPALLIGSVTSLAIAAAASTEPRVGDVNVDRDDPGGRHCLRAGAARTAAKAPPMSGLSDVSSVSTKAVGPA